MTGVEGLGRVAPEGECDLRVGLVHQRDLPLGQLLPCLGGDVGGVPGSLHHPDDVHVAVLGTAGEVADTHEVVGDGGDVPGVLGQLHHSVVLEGKLVVVVELGVLLVGVLDGAITDVEDFPHDSLVVEGVTLLLESCDSDLPGVVHHVH